MRKEGHKCDSQAKVNPELPWARCKAHQDLVLTYQPNNIPAMSLPLYLVDVASLGVVFMAGESGSFARAKRGTCETIYSHYGFTYTLLTRRKVEA